MRTLTPTAVEELLAQHTNEVYLHIVKIDHADLGSPLRFVDNTVDIVRSDGTYTAAAFRVQLPAEDDQAPQIRLTIDNVDQSIIQVLRSLASRPSLSISVIRASNPNTIEIGPFDVTLSQFDYDKYSITGYLEYEEDFLNTTFPKGQFTPETAPAIF